jgi:hypothetical protein
VIDDLSEAARASDDRRVRRLLSQSGVLQSQPHRTGEPSDTVEAGAP